jgi:methylthioribose-1-phosphate isomerase
MIRPMVWEADRLLMLDQRQLPGREVWLELKSPGEVAEAIQLMAVRGAPAIGVAAAYGLALAALRGEDQATASAILAASRPTAVNLFWAIQRIAGLPTQSFEAVLAEAKAIEAEDLAMNLRLAEHGSNLVPHGGGVLTICNTGSLATAGHGTALGIIRTAHSQGKGIHVYSCETRPRQQGLRLTAYELMKEGIPFHSIVDSAAGSLMRSGKVQLVLAGADRIAVNGDTANKIGTYSLAVLARHHGIPFAIAAPSSTLDMATASGDEITIEERSSMEVTHCEHGPVAPEECPVLNPGFDVTPGNLISAIVTETGVYQPPYNFAPPS